VALLLAGSTWFYIQDVMIGHQVSNAVTHNIPRGNLSDLYPRWLGTRELLLHHRDPYSASVTREIQIGYYGRPLDPGQPYDPKDPQAFAYPVYVVFLLAPTIGLPFHEVQKGFFWLLTLLTAGSVFIWLRFLQWRISWIAITTIIVLTLGSFSVLQALKLQQLSLLVSGILAGCALSLIEGHLVLAGVLLALASIKPQVSCLLTCWFLLWAVNDWRRRKGLVWGFSLTLAGFFAGSEYILPGWLSRFREAVAAYYTYTGGPGSVLVQLIGPGPGMVVSIVAVVALAAFCWRNRFAAADSPVFRAITLLVLALSVVVIPKMPSYNQILLLPGILLVLRDRKTLWYYSWPVRACVVIPGLALCWPWIASSMLTFAWFTFSPRSVQKIWTLPIYATLHLPVAVSLLVAIDAVYIRNPERKTLRLLPAREEK
jgi:hypothetical protein